MVLTEIWWSWVCVEELGGWRKVWRWLYEVVTDCEGVSKRCNRDVKIMSECDRIECVEIGVWIWNEGECWSMPLW